MVSYVRIGLLVTVGAFVLAGCNDQQSAEADKILKQVNEKTAKACQYKASSDAIADIGTILFPGGAAIATVVKGISSAVCSGVKADGKKGVADPREYSTVVKGRRIPLKGELVTKP